MILPVMSGDQVEVGGEFAEGLHARRVAGVVRIWCFVVVADDQTGGVNLAVAEFAIYKECYDGWLVSFKRGSDDRAYGRG